MTTGDVVIEHVETVAPGVGVLLPERGSTPLAHLVIDIDIADASAEVAACDEVTAGLHGSLDVGHAQSYSPGRWRLDVPVVMLEPSFCVTVWAHHGPDGHRHRTALVTLTGFNDRASLRTGGIQALMMHQLGRAGSTMMMRVLAGHPEIAVFDDYPLETRPGLAWMHSLATLLGTSTVAPGDEPFFDEAASTTANPYLSEYFLGPDILAAQYRGGFDRLRRVVADMVEDTYLQRRPGARFFAEKFRIESRFAARTQQTTIATWPESRQIILVRDPRDLLCSRLSFNRQREEASFDLDLNDDAVTGAPTIVDHLRLAARQVAAFPDAIVVRYEDLVANPVATATRLFRDLDVDHGYAAVSSAVANAVSARSDAHSTTASPASSIGRWRTELPAEAARHLSDELAGELALFGYET